MNDELLISLVIPVYNESQSIGLLIETIMAQQSQPSEIIIVDGGSTDNTVALIKEICKDKPQFRVIEAGRAMPGKGRNIGAAQVKTEWIAFTDAGIKLDKLWLKKLSAMASEDKQVGIVYGNYEPQINSFFEKCAAITYVPGKIPGKIRGKTIVSCLLKKEVWEKAGGFPDWRAAEDLVFMENADQLKYAAAFAPEAIAYWELRPDIFSTYRKFDLYSMYNVWAGRQAFWHYGIARQYLLMLIPLALSIIYAWYWLLLIPLWLLGRVAKRILLHRHEFGLKVLFNPAVVLLIAIITIAVDAGTFTGWAKAIFRKNQLKIKLIEPA